MISHNIKLRNRLRELSDKHSEIVDIVLFGSIIRGKEKPNDIDILILFDNKIDKGTEYTIRKEFEKHYKDVSIISKTKKTSMDESFDARESILFEGKSLITDESHAGKYGFTSFGMFKYNFTGWTKPKKTKFYHALNGRGDKKGIASLLNCIKLSDSLILTPLDKIESFKEFLESWKIDYKYIPTLIPQRLSRKKILE